jgi:UDP-2-acetamido-2,6-beta-L-arabino-hexul-4-ose reductase
MKKIGVTGQKGFIGYHLFQTLGLLSDEFSLIPFEKEFFTNEDQLQKFVSECDVIIHLAAMNRHNDPEVIYKNNISLVEKLIAAMQKTNSKPHVIFSSSSQEERDNLYGRSKKDGRMLFEKWADDNNTQFTGVIIPNVFGPFGNPYYNSVIATFCHQLTHNEKPKIDVDGEIKLIYVSELVKEIKDIIRNTKKAIQLKRIEHTATIKVSTLLEKLQNYKDNYFEKGIVPDLNSVFDRNLFITFLCYIEHRSFFPFYLTKNTDTRGSFVETVKLNSVGQVSFSTTVSGITRGNHFHTRKAERFAVIKGKALIELRKIGTEEIISFELDGNKPSFVDMPVWHTHNIKNIGNEELYTIFWINEFYDQNDPDTYFITV